MRYVISFLLFLLISGEIQAAPLRVVATTGIVADLVKNVGGDQVEVSALMGPGVDPHLYKATQGDLKRLGQAELVVSSGLHLEGKMSDVLTALGKRTSTLALGNAISASLLRNPPEFEGHPDPHIWFDVSLWARTIDPLVAELVRLRPEARAGIEQRASEYRSELAALHDWVTAQIHSIPSGNRVLITAHDAFGYFGAAYGIEVMGLQGISTASEYGLQDVIRISEVITSRKVKAIFAESSVPVRFIQSLQEGVRAKGYEVSHGGELYSDALGAADSTSGTYMGMIRHNVTTIVEALR